MTSKNHQVVAGFIPLLDSAVLVAAAHCGFAQVEGIDLKLVRETSWANIRDRMYVGHFDVAHMLAPMPIASSLSLMSLSVPMRAPMVLGLGGNAITVTNAVAAELIDAAWNGSIDPSSSGNALNLVVRNRAKSKMAPLRFGVVHPFSGHAYELRYWLAAAGISPEHDVEIRVLPPSFMADALGTGQIDGYCVGEPWNTAAVLAGTGRIVTCKQAIWPDSPEKVLGVTERWALSDPDRLDALIRSLAKAADWCAQTDNLKELATILSHYDILNCPPAQCLPALSNNMQLTSGENTKIPGFLSFGGGVCAAPQMSQGYWFYSQMVRWGQASFSDADLETVAKVFDYALISRALNLKPEQLEAAACAPLLFFDEKSFSVDAVAEYVTNSPN
ncbi:CmpA/NrtA family ABC transporter substrate-binding protein [Cohaesibacter celericrescens]|uniref:Nitrate transporter n=1 Tax=Cohaesibacter celericrescens TaxID=2067669 RepID=A0A2N5XXM8_9HYPH|nr:CmpA/NrtA family ABC transporter substrate-binding protein [Cohaesibacter celericrescens]PLW79188.1 nitrate transporter [Cohaesibacter celericrescens]